MGEKYRIPKKNDVRGLGSWVLGCLRFFDARKTAYALALGAAILFAAKGIFVKFGYGLGLDGSVQLFWRMILSLPVYVLSGTFAYQSFKKKHQIAPSKQTLSIQALVKIASVGILGYWFASYTDFLSLKTLTPPFERLVLFTYPLFVVLLGALFFQKPIKPIAYVCFIICYFGIGIVFMHDINIFGPSVYEGVFWVLLSSISFALYLLLAKPLIETYGAMLFTSIAMIGATIASIAVFFILGGVEKIRFSPEIIMWGLGIAIGSTILPSFMTSKALSVLSASTSAIISYLNPFFVIIFTIVFLNILPTFTDLLGLFFVLFGVGLYSYLDLKGRPKGDASAPMLTEDHKS